MSEPLPREKTNVLILALSQALFMIAGITVMTLSGVVGFQLADSPALATLPVALMKVGALLATFPASMLMKRLGRRPGFVMGTTIGGVAGAGVAALGITLESFALFCAGNFLLGIYQAFAMYYRFAAADCASDSFRSRAISLVMAGGVVAAFLGPWNANHAQALWSAHPEAGPFLVLAGLAVLATLLVGVLQVPPEREPAGVSEAQRPMTTIAAQPAFVIALLAGVVSYTAMTLVMAATPLAMQQVDFTMGQIAQVMQWHVLGMFVPSFFTGSLIARHGVLNVLLWGGAIMVLSVIVAVAGTTFWHFWTALLLLGVGWNFLFIGGSTLLTRTHTTEERGKVQGTNDLAIFALVAVGSLLSGALLHAVGWIGLNLAMLPFVAVTLAATAWLRFGVAARGSAPAPGEAPRG